MTTKLSNTTQTNQPGTN